MVRYDLNLFEVWKPIPEHPNYDVSSEGRIWSHKTQKVLKQHTNQKGYYRVRMDNKMYSVARLVCMAFLPNENKDLTEVNHIDEDKSNNSINNLEWCNREYNVNYGNRMQKQRYTCYSRGLWNQEYEGLDVKTRRSKYKEDHKEQVKLNKKKNYLKNRSYYLEYYKQWRQNKKNKK